MCPWAGTTIPITVPMTPSDAFSGRGGLPGRWGVMLYRDDEVSLGDEVYSNFNFLINIFIFQGVPGSLGMVSY